MCGDEDVAGVKHRVEELGLQNRIEHVGWIAGGRTGGMSEPGDAACPSVLSGRAAHEYSGDHGTGNSQYQYKDRLDSGGYTGWGKWLLITPGDVEALQNRILKLVSEDRLRRNFQKKERGSSGNRFPESVN